MLTDEDMLGVEIPYEEDVDLPSKLTIEALEPKPRYDFDLWMITPGETASVAHISVAVCGYAVPSRSESMSSKNIKVTFESRKPLTGWVGNRHRQTTGRDRHTTYEQDLVYGSTRTRAGGQLCASPSAA